MSSNTGLPGETPIPVLPGQKYSPFKLSVFLIFLIYLAETLTMALLYYVKLPSYILYTLLDGALMLVIIFPALYFLQWKPLLRQIDERTQAEQALRSSETHLKRVMELLPVGVWIINKDGEVTQGNPASQMIWAGARYVGKEQYSEYKGWWVKSGEPIKSNEWAAARALATGEISINEEINIEAFDGSQKTILNSAVPILDEENAIQGAIVVNQDITALKHAREALEERERALTKTNELLEKSFFSIDTLIAYMDKDFNFIRVNETYARSAAHDPEWFTGKNHFELYPHEENQVIFRRVVETGEPYIVLEKPFEYPEYPERGVTYWDWSLQPVKGDQGAVEGLVLSLVDVTERKRAEIQLERKNQELLALSKAEREQRELAESLVQATITLSSSLKLEEVLNAILEQIRRTIPFQMADIVFLEDRTMRVVGYRAFEGHPDVIEAMKKLYALDDFPYWLKAFSTQKPVLIEDTRTFPGWFKVPGMEWVSSFATAPLIGAGQVIGFINLTSDQPGYFNEGTITRLQAFAVPAALAIQNARLYMAESKARQFAEVLSAAVKDLTKTLDLEHVTHTLLDHLMLVVQSDIAGVSLMQDETHLSLQAVRGPAQSGGIENVPVFPIDGVTDSVIHRLMADRKSFIIPKIYHASPQEDQPGPGQNHNWLIVPVIASEKVIGLVELGRAGDEKFFPELVQRTEALVGQAAVAIQNAWLFQQVRSSSERLQSLARKLVEVQENERNHVARELHDEAGQSLASLKLSLGRLQQDPDCTQHMRQSLEELKVLADCVLEELHRLAIDLRPIALDHLGLVAALAQHARNLTSESLSIQFKAIGFEGARLPKDIETCLYRIAQEALANVIRHAQAANIGILLERVEGSVKLFIEDDGIGFDPGLHEHGNRLGLVGMRERAEMFGGTLTIESHPGEGTSIIVEVPDVDKHPDRG